MTNRTWMTAGVWIIATVAIGMVLNQGARILAPFAMAIFVWLVMEGFARAIRRPFPNIPNWLAHAFAIAVVAISIIGFASIMRGAIGEFTERAGEYESRINTLIEQTYNMLGLAGERADIVAPDVSPSASGSAALPAQAPPLTPGEAAALAGVEAPPPVVEPAPVIAAEAASQAVASGKPPTLSDLFYSDTTIGLAQAAANSVSGLIGDMVIIMIYVAFLFVTANTFTRKFDRIFARPEDRERARLIGADVRRTMEQYLWVQTSLSTINTSLTYVTLLSLGLHNALFWAFVIFVLNYIPTIGSIVAGILPALFAFVQDDWPAYMPQDELWCAAAVFFGVSIWQFLIGNFLGPRMTSNSLNLSALVVLLSLAVWGALWGLPGMFLSAPLTVLVMIVLAQIPGARWIAVLMSADGNPGEYAVKHDEPGNELANG
ncbi:MAG: AI-2E family transporter [Hyphomonadaceae bacterium]|nr:AI-2E family transporter [Hyphomonadaceae bacterium]